MKTNIIYCFRNGISINMLSCWTHIYIYALLDKVNNLFHHFTTNT